MLTEKEWADCPDGNVCWNCEKWKTQKEREKNCEVVKARVKTINKLKRKAEREKGRE